MFLNWLKLAQRRPPPSSVHRWTFPAGMKYLYDPTLADAICDRIVHDSYVIQVHGESMRKRKGILE